MNKNDYTVVYNRNTDIDVGVEYAYEQWKNIDDNKDFVNSIIGTFDYKENGSKIQIVVVDCMVDNCVNIEDWYESVTDLPVFIKYSQVGPAVFRVRSKILGRLSKLGILRRIEYEREQKYRDKGFHVWNMF